MRLEYIVEERQVSVVEHRYSYKLGNLHHHATTEGDIAVRLEYIVEERHILLLKKNQP